MADLRRAIQRRRAAELTVDPLIDVIAEFAGAVSDAVGKSYNLQNSRAERFLKAYMAERVAMVNATTREALQEAMRSDDPRSAVREVFRLARESRARQIAETEVVRSSNWAAIDAGKWVGELAFKRWATQQDAAVRPEHAEMHGQVVGWTEPFTAPDGSKAQWPGGFSSPHLSVNCRCAAVPTSEAVEHEFDADPVELYDRLRAPFVDELEQAWRGVFDEQEAAVLEDLG